MSLDRNDADAGGVCAGAPPETQTVTPDAITIHSGIAGGAAPETEQIASDHRHRQGRGAHLTSCAARGVQRRGLEVW